MDSFGYRRYPPSILLISGHQPGTPELRRNLENHGCRVQQIEAGLETLLEVGHTFFDAIVLKIERFDRTVEEVCEKLATDRELVALPVIVLLRPGAGQAAGAKLEILPPVHYLTWDSGVDAKLLQIIEEIHYLTDRYA